MFNVSEYKTKHKQLINRLPWGLFVAPGIIQQKTGALQTTYRFRGDNPLILSDSKNGTIASLLNNAFRRLGSGWAVFVEEQKREIKTFREGQWPHELAIRIEKEQLESLKKERQYITEQYMTFVYMPPSEISQKVENKFYEGGQNQDYTTTIKNFRAEVAGIAKILLSLLPEMTPLNDDETCTYLHSCISTKNHKIKAPAVPCFLDYLLTDEPVTGGFEPKIGDYHLGVVSVKGYPEETRPNIFAALTNMPFEYRWVSRFICLDKEEAVKEFDKYSRDWTSSRVALKDFITKLIFKDKDSIETPKENGYAADLAKQSEEAEYLVRAGHVSGGYFTQAVITWDKTESGLQTKKEMIEAEINNAMFVSVNEKMNAMQAWFGSLPGHVYANVRRPLITSLPFAHMISSASHWNGPEKNTHLDGPPLFIARTESSAPFRYSNHVEDVGSMAILGPTGTGKSTLLNYIALCYQKYDAQIFFFDYHYSAYVNTVLNGGVHYSIGDDQSVTFQPLRNIDNDQERAWAYSWLINLLKTEKVDVSPVIKKELWATLTNLASAAKPENRTLTNLVTIVQDKTIREALQEYTFRGPYGYLFDSETDHFGGSRWQTYEMSHLMEDMPGAVNPLLTYLMHRIDKAMTGIPTLIPQDESWMFMENEIYGDQLRKWTKTIRKHNGAIVLASTSLADIRENKNASSLIDSLPTKVYLPNAEILDESNQALYRGFGLNEKEIKILAEAQGKRDYYVKSKLGSRKIDLGLGELALAVCGSSSKSDIRTMKHLCERLKNLDAIRQTFLEYKGATYEKNLSDNDYNGDVFNDTSVLPDRVAGAARC
jgi:type IV secretion system protein VirB4